MNGRSITINFNNIIIITIINLQELIVITTI